MSQSQVDAFEGFKFQLGQKVDTVPASLHAQIIERRLVETPAGICRKYTVAVPHFDELLEMYEMELSEVQQ